MNLGEVPIKSKAGIIYSSDEVGLVLLSSF